MKRFALCDVLDSTAVFRCLTVLAVLAPAAFADAQALEAGPTEGRWVGIETGFGSVPTLVAKLNRSGGDLPTPHGGGCPQELASHTDADFTGGQFTIQAGFAETEIAAASYTLDAADFPFQISLLEMIFAQNHFNPTTTMWSIHVWEGTPSTGNQVFTAQSDDIILPHLTLPFLGSNGANIQVSIDPGDPDQIIVTDDGSHTFSIGYGIVQHNNQTGNGCGGSADIPTASNAFPTTDVSGLSTNTQNWIFGINCGPGSCVTGGSPSNWNRFIDMLCPFPPLICCIPSGDWVMRATYTPFECVLPTGACCFGDETCQVLTNPACSGAGGSYVGDDVACVPTLCDLPTGICCLPIGDCEERTQVACEADSGFYAGDDTVCTLPNICPQPEGACCFTPTACLSLSLADCDLAAGTWQGPLTECVPGSGACPLGACCLPDGNCVGPISSDDCANQSGTYQGDTTPCSQVTCPQPNGACCLATGGCLLLTAADCSVIPNATWAGPLTICPDDCVPPCPGATGDINGDTFVNGLDANAFIQAMFGNPTPEEVCAGDFDGQNGLDSNDVPGFAAALLAG